MKKHVKALLSLLLVLVLCAGSAAGFAAYAKTGVKVEKASVPKGSMQGSYHFPDRFDIIDDALAENNTVSFLTYAGQGTLYLTVKDGVEDFRLFVNQKRVRTERMKAGNTYKVDISSLTKDGKNSLQLSNIVPRSLKDAVHVDIPYPVVTDGSLKDAGIDKLPLQMIDSIISSDVKHGFSSAQLAVVKSGRLVYENAWGQKNRYTEDLKPIEKGDTVDNDTLYDLASNTKMYSVNYGIQYLVSQGKIKMDDTIASILGPSYVDSTIDIPYEEGDAKDLATVKQWKNEITVKDVLSHRAGYPADPAYFNPEFNQVTQKVEKGAENVLYSGAGPSEAVRENTYREILKTPTMHKPGTSFLYSDLDYMLLGFCIEKITGQTLQDFLSETFWKPMGLTHITYKPLENGFEKEDCAATEINGNTRQHAVSFPNVRTHTIQGEVHDSKAYYSMDGVAGHAGLFSNAADLAKLASVMITGGYGDTKFFDKDVIDLVSSIQTEDNPQWGAGWYHKGTDGKVWYFGDMASPQSVGHQGWTGTWTMIDPEEDLVVVFLTNKINTPLVHPEEDAKSFTGNRYTTASLGFVPEILYRGIDAEGTDLRETLLSMYGDMVSEKWKLVEQTSDKEMKQTEREAALALHESYLTFVKKYGSREDKKLAQSSLDILPKNDPAKNTLQKLL